MEGKTCCVTGHRDISWEQIDFIKEALEREIDAAIAEGFTRFMSGFADGADIIFARIVAEKRLENTNLRLEAAIPYRNRLLRLLDDEMLKPLLLSCTDISIHGERYDSGVYMDRNRYMVSTSDRVIAVYDGRQTGGTANTLRYARSLHKDVREIAIPRQAPAERPKKEYIRL